MSENKMHAGLLGEKLGHSFSPQIHALITDEYDYTLFERSAEEVGAFLRGHEWDALNVTIPYKKTVMPYMDELSDTAARIGSVNTVTRLPDGRLRGDNTDFVGFAALVRSLGFDPKGKKALVLGSGGASLTAQTVLADSGAQVVVISRTGEDNYENLYNRHADAALIVNATPVGMYPKNGASPVDLSRLPCVEGVLDMIYNPIRTSLLLQAACRGIPCQNGLLMLVAQAVAASDRFLQRTRTPEEFTACVQAVTNTIDQRTANIILVGMPGCGKSTVAAALGEVLGRPVVDTDAEIVHKTGTSIPDIFRRVGEEGFRAIESEVVRAVGNENGGTPGHTVGSIISTGGGVVTRGINRDPLRQNGRVVFIKRDIRNLSREGRPLSLTTDLQTMYQTRLPLYRAFCDVEVSNDGTVEETVLQILDALGMR